MPEEIEPYGIMPYSDISELKKQVRQLETKDNPNSDELLKSVTALTRNMDSMLQLFKTAAEEMKLEEQEERAISHQIKPLMDKLDEIIEQNKIIAEGMVALSDIIKDRMPEEKQDEEDEKPSSPFDLEQQAPPIMPSQIEPPRNQPKSQQYVMPTPPQPPQSQPNFPPPSMAPPMMPPQEPSLPPPMQSMQNFPPPQSRPQPMFPPPRQQPPQQMMSQFPPRIQPPQQQYNPPDLSEGSFPFGPDLNAPPQLPSMQNMPPPTFGPPPLDLPPPPKAKKKGLFGK